jgi:hypothetical protein
MMINREHESHRYIRQNGRRDAVIRRLEERIGVLENTLNDSSLTQMSPSYLMTYVTLSLNSADSGLTGMNRIPNNVTLTE